MKELELAIGKIENFVRQLRTAFSQPVPQQQAPDAQQGQPPAAQVAQPPVQPQPAQPAQLNADNLQTVQQQQAALRNKQAQAATANRRNQQKTPAAPTEAKPPFQIGPDGVPAYASPGLAPGELKLPPKKKAKTAHGGSAASTPAQAVPTHASPKVPEVVASPEVKRPPVPEPAKVVTPEVQPLFKCPVAECDSKGFGSQYELDKHKNDVHVKIDDPFQYVLDSVVGAFDLNPDGTSKAPKQDVVAVAQAKDTKTPNPSKSQPSAAKAAGTPTAKPRDSATPSGAASTPMDRVPTQQSLKTPQTVAKPATPRSTPSKLGAKPSTPSAQPQKAPVEQPPAEPTPAAEPPLDTFDWDEYIHECFDGIDGVAGTLSVEPPMLLSSSSTTTPSPKTSDGATDAELSAPAVGLPLTTSAKPSDTAALAGAVMDASMLDDLWALGVDPMADSDLLEPSGADMLATLWEDPPSAVQVKYHYGPRDHLTIAVEEIDSLFGYQPDLV